MSMTMPPPPGGSTAPSRTSWVALFTAFVAGALVATLALVSIVDSRFDPRPLASGGGFAVEEPTDVEEGDGAAGGRTRVVEQRVGGSEGEESQAGGGGAQLGGGSGPGGLAGGGSGGSASDATGVSDTSIRLGATVVRDGIAKDFLGEVEKGMDAVINRVNSRPNGIHGRRLQIVYKNDNWEADTGRRFLENLIVQEQVFALAVSPSSEGLNAASEVGMFRDHQVPVVGADGLNNTQFLDPWIWPVAAATTTQVHVIMKEAWDRCEATSGCGKSKGGPGLQPAIVFGNTYKFGVEGSYAFNQAYKQLSGEDIHGFSAGGTSCIAGTRFCGVPASGGEEYTTETNTVKRACDDAGTQGGPCNFVLLLLEPKSALSWMRGIKFPAAEYFERDGKCCGMAGAQPLFTRNFAKECDDKCNRMHVWTGYNPPIGKYQSEPAVKQYTDELQARDPNADLNNQFTLGGYVGMTLLVEALDEVGRDLTRSKLAATLNTLKLDTGLTHSGGLSWNELGTSPGARYANRWAQAFRIDSTFGEFREAVGYIEDPWLGRDNKLPR